MASCKAGSACLAVWAEGLGRIWVEGSGCNSEDSVDSFELLTGK
jgi:hypothetical protein